MNILSQLEAILFVASRPLEIKKIAKALKSSTDEVDTAIDQLMQKYTGVSGIHITMVGDSVQMTTNPEYADVVDQFVKSDTQGELTKAQLETLTVIAYRGPITRPELEEIRGVNCSVILRNLIVRGLISEHEQDDSVLPSYELSIDALRFLGISSVQELPEYDTLSAHPHLDQSDNTQEDD